MRATVAFFVLTGIGCGMAAADDVPLPRPRPPMPAVWSEPRTFREAAEPDFDSKAVTDRPTDCDERLARIAEFTPMPRLIGPGTCGGRDMVEVTSVRLTGDKRVAVEPAALLNCAMAESLAAWLRDEAAPRAAALGSPLKKIENYDSYECRTRNRVRGAKLSEHAHGDAIDVRAFHLADGRRLELTDAHVDKPLRVALRDSVCHRFTTVLGPGDANHEGHIHLDVIQRRGGYRICQWDVREPPPPPPQKPAEEKVARADAAAKPDAAPAPSEPDSSVAENKLPAETGVKLAEVAVPLPPPRPAIADNAHQKRRKSRTHFHLPFTLWR